MGIEEGRVICRQYDVGFPQEVERTTTGHPVHSGNHGLPKSLRSRPDEDSGIFIGQRVERVGDVPSIDSRTESLVSPSGQYDRADLVILSQCPHKLAKFL